MLSAELKAFFDDPQVATVRVHFPKLDLFGVYQVTRMKRRYVDAWAPPVPLTEIQRLNLAYWDDYMRRLTLTV